MAFIVWVHMGDHHRWMLEAMGTRVGAARSEGANWQGRVVRGGGLARVKVVGIKKWGGRINFDLLHPFCYSF